MNNIVQHTLEPVFNRDSRILILGTMPSPKSREAGFYYSHPQNRFWRVMSAVLSMDTPRTAGEKKSFLLDNKIALWDVLKSCSIKGADDGSISNPEANDLSCIFKEADIQAVFTTGRKATELYRKYCSNNANTNQPIYLPSPSPANCGISFDDIVEDYRIILNYL